MKEEQEKNGRHSACHVEAGEEGTYLVRCSLKEEVTKRNKKGKQKIAHDFSRGN